MPERMTREVSDVTIALSRNVLHFGHDEPLPEQTMLRAGPLSMVYEEGGLRFISLGDREVLRGIYMAVRDRNWRTIPCALEHTQMQIAESSFSITYNATNCSDDVDFSWTAAIMGDASGTITFAMAGVARRTFLRSRIGFCVLHGTRECAGRPCEIEHTDGTIQHGTFPYLISPHQPFLEMRAISHEVAPGLWAEVRLTGDVFEMEDQRNWTDASFKTYCTPLRLPFPVEVPEGTTVAQSATLRLRGTAPSIPRESSSRVRLTIGAPSMAVPRIGLGVASHGQPLTEQEVRRLAALNLSHLRVDLFLDRQNYVEALERATREATALGVALEVALFLSDRASDELHTLRGVLDRVRPPLWAWLVFHANEPSTTTQWCALAREVLAGYDPTARIGGGAYKNFAELNRGHPPTDVLDLMCYSVNPQAHAFDNTSLIESFEGCRWTVTSARHLAPSVPLAVTPITLRPRFPRPASELSPAELPPQVDPRQMSLFGAVWTVGVLKAFAESGVESLTLYETTGWRGVMETAEGSPLPHLFKSFPGAVFPLYHVLAAAGECSGGRIAPVTSSAPMTVDGVAFERNGGHRILAANFTERSIPVMLEGLAAHVRVRLLDERNVLAVMQDPATFRREPGTLHPDSGGRFELQLHPYAVACVDAVRPSEANR